MKEHSRNVLWPVLSWITKSSFLWENTVEYRFSCLTLVGNTIPSEKLIDKGHSELAHVEAQAISTAWTLRLNQPCNCRCSGVNYTHQSTGSYKADILIYFHHLLVRVFVVSNYMSPQTSLNKFFLTLQTRNIIDINCKQYVPKTKSHD